jgi:hypothetical protein
MSPARHKDMVKGIRTNYVRLIRQASMGSNGDGNAK